MSVSNPNYRIDLGDSNLTTQFEIRKKTIVICIDIRRIAFVFTSDKTEVFVCAVACRRVAFESHKYEVVRVSIEYGIASDTASFDEGGHAFTVGIYTATVVSVSNPNYRIDLGDSNLGASPLSRINIE